MVLPMAACGEEAHPQQKGFFSKVKELFGTEEAEDQDVANG